MATAWPGEESFSCSVCLDTLKDPTTLPCGHSYCLGCIQNHWDKEQDKHQFSCPQCRQVFNPRPHLAKSTVLAEAMEKLRSNSVKEGGSTSSTSTPVGSSASPSIPVYVDVLPALPQRTDSVYPQLPSVEPRLCAQHNRPLDLFCHDDKECVCLMCCQYGHRGHRVLKPQEERREKQKEIFQMQDEVKKRIQDTEKTLSLFPHTSRQHKAMIQALERESADIFSDLVKTLSLTGAQVAELLSGHESTMSSNMEGQINGLEQELVQLRWRSEELTRLTGMQDDVCFLKNFVLMEPLERGGGKAGLSGEEVNITAIRSAIKEMQESVQDTTKAAVEKIIKLVNNEGVMPTNGEVAPPVAPAAHVAPVPPSEVKAILNPPDPARANTTGQTSHPPLPPLPHPEHELSKFGRAATHHVSASAPPPPHIPPRPLASLRVAVGHTNPEPKTREELLKFRFEPTIDPNTAYRHVHVSDDCRKATMKAENLNPPDHPDRFMFWRQVLCREPLGGSPYYWEMEWTGKKVTVGVAYKEMERKTSNDLSRLGHNAQSWGLYWSGTGFSFWHDRQEKLLGSPKARRIGIYLDQHMGVLSFYSITSNRAVLIYRHETQFSGPLYPGIRFWSGVGDTLTICQLD